MTGSELFSKCSHVLGGDEETTNPQNLPSFKWLSNLSPGGVPLLDVHFHDGGPDDTVALTNSNPIPTQVFYVQMYFFVQISESDLMPSLSLIF